MVVINGKTLNTCMAISQGTDLLQTIKKGKKIIAIYEGLKRASSFEKEHFRDPERQKNIWLPLHQCVFFSPIDQNKCFHNFLKEGMHPNVRHIKCSH